jgi:hypothetical protein
MIDINRDLYVDGSSNRVYKEISTTSCWPDLYFNEYKLTDHENWEGFEAYVVDKEYFIKNDSIIADLHYKFGVYNIAILKMEPYSIYPQHTDLFKKCKINMLLTPQHKSYTFFVNKNNTFDELAYKKNHYYIFNTQQTHMIINFSQPRYLFTILFSNNLEFNTLCQYYE